MTGTSLKRLQRVFVILGYLLFCQHTFAQEIFQISTEPGPSQFIQHDPVIFTAPGGRFLAAWWDDRDGLPGYYAQYFDDDGSRIGSNFKILSNEAVAFGPSDEFMVIGHKNEYLSGQEYYITYGELYQVSRSLSGPFKIARFLVPPDVLGCPAFGTSLGSFSHGYLLGDAFNGESVIQEFDFNGNQIYAAPDSVIPAFALGFAMATTLDGHHVLFWIGANEYMESTGLYARFFSPDHQILADSVFFGNRWNVCDMGYSMRALTLSDSLYQLFFTSEDTLWYLTTTLNGSLQKSPSYIVVHRPVEVPDNARSRQTQFGISNALDEVFTLFLTRTFWWWDNQGVSRTLHQTRKQDFAADGHPIGDSLVSATPFSFVHNLRKLDTHTFQIPLARNDDIYLYTLRDLTVEDSLKVNDDSLGANQRRPSAIAAPEGKFLVLWQDERGKKARLIDGTGILLGEEFTPAFQTGWYFPDGEFLTFWEDEEKSGLVLGYRIYSAGWQVVTEQPLVHRGKISPWWINALGTVLDNDLFVTLLQDSTDLHLLKISKTRGVLADSLIAQEENPYPLKLALDGDGLIWAVWRTTPYWKAKVVGFNKQLKQISAKITLDDLFNGQIAFLSQGLFAYLAQVQYVTEGEPGYYLVYRHALEDRFPQRFKFASFNATDVRLQKLDEAHVLVTWELERTIWSQVYDRQGTTLTDPIAIHTSPTLSYLQPFARVNGDRVLYVWSDALLEAHGRDIFGLLLPARKLITSVRSLSEAHPKTFILQQNYPNPFNPETTIEYELAKPGHVRLTIYNLLGQRISTLVDAWQPAGRYRVRWDGHAEGGAQSVASGVYVVELRLGEKTMRRKMILLR